MDKNPCVYMLASGRNGTFYIGVTSNLAVRIAQHKAGEVEGFAKKCGVRNLVWYEPHETMNSVIVREKQMKKWHRAWKIHLIMHGNPEWRDLTENIC